MQPALFSFNVAPYLKNDWMPTLNLSSQYQKLAYLEVIGITPLVAVRAAGEQLVPLRVLVKSPATQTVVNRDMNRASGHSESNSASPSPLYVPDAKKDAVSALSSARSILQGAASAAPDSVPQENSVAASHGSLRSRESGLESLPATPKVDQGRSAQYASISDTDSYRVEEVESPQNPGRDITPDPQESSGIVSDQDLPASIQLPSRFSVLMCTSHHLTVIALEPTLMPDHWNLIRNIALASNPPQLEVKESRSLPAMLEFRWPIPGIAPGADQGAAAQSALSGFLTKQIDTSSRFIVLGDQAAHAAEIYLGQLEASRILKAATLDDMLKNSNAKRDLWREMRARGFA